jgi:protein O-GlcNAc transferase
VIDSSAPSAPDPLAALLDTATQHHRAGRLGEARRLYAEYLRARPDDALGLFRSGLLDLQEDRPEAAREALCRAVARAPHEARFHFGHAQALATLREYGAAALAYEQALSIDPALAEGWVGLGIAHEQRGEIAAAVCAYRRALDIDAHTAGAAGRLGAALGSRGEFTEAVSWLERARTLEPDVPDHILHLGLALERLGRHDAALRVLEELIGLEPVSAQTAFARAQALRALGRRHEALANYERALAEQPAFPEALINIGNIHREQGELARARNAYAAALALRPDDVLAINNLAALLRVQGELDAAEDLLRRGLEVAPRHAVLHDTLGNVLKDQGALEEALQCFRAALALDPERPVTHSNLAYALSFQALEPATLLEEAGRWQARFADPITPRRQWRCERSPGRRLRIGYVSPDFRDHCQSLFMQPVLAQHDHTAFEIVCYSSALKRDERTRQLAGLADRWCEVAALADAALAEKIFDDEVDVLVDLTMHMAGGRPLLFARKPAPVQIAWLAYPGTTGLATMDYRVSDPHLDPPQAQPHAIERTLRLPDSFWCYDPLAHEPAVSELPALSRPYVTFGCLNNPCKLTEQTLRLWAPVLAALPDSRLRLLAPHGRSRQRLAHRFALHGVDPARLEFVDFRPRAEYLAAYHEIDLGLDSIPYNGHTTSLDALWMGVPTVTRVGATPVGRAGLSQLHALGLTDLVAGSDGEFVAIALGLARDLERLATLRATLRLRLERCALMDASRFTRALEALYRAAWHDHCADR